MSMFNIQIFNVQPQTSLKPGGDDSEMKFWTDRNGHSVGSVLYMGRSIACHVSEEAEDVILHRRGETEPRTTFVLRKHRYSGELQVVEMRRDWLVNTPTEVESRPPKTTKPDLSKVFYFSNHIDYPA